MLKISSDNKDKFIQNKEYVLSFLESKGVKDKYYLNLIRENDFGCLEPNTIYLNSHDMNSGDYQIEAFLTCASDYNDIVETNENLEWTAKDIGAESECDRGIAIAAVAGDGVLWLDIKTGKVYLWLVGTGNFEKVYFAPSVKKLVKMIRYEKS